MKRIVLALCLVAFAAEAHAISRHTSTSMSCDQVRGTLQREGAAILQYRSTRNPSLKLYDRYVADRRYCKIEEFAELAYVPAADTQSCPVRKCKVYDPDDDVIFWRR